MIDLIVFTLLILIFIAINIYNSRLQKARDEEQMQKLMQTKEAMDNLAEALKNSAPDIVEFQSLKRWMATTIKALQEHGDKMDEVFQVHESIEVLEDGQDGE